MTTTTTTRSLIAIALIASFVTARPSQGKSLESENVIISQYPYMVSIEHLGHFAGSGVIVNDNYVLTTASCADNAKPAELTIRAGTSLHGQGGQVYKVNKIVLHEKYPNRTLTNQLTSGYDVAVLRIVGNFVFNDEHQPAPLFNRSDVVKPNAEAAVIGWGDPRTNELSLQMQLSRLEVVERGNDVADGQLSAEGPGRQLCRGDLAGPLHVDGKLAGLAAWGFECAKSTKPTVFTDIAKFRAWIDEHARF